MKYLYPHAHICMVERIKYKHQAFSNERESLLKNQLKNFFTSKLLTENVGRGNAIANINTFMNCEVLHVALVNQAEAC